MLELLISLRRSGGVGEVGGATRTAEDTGLYAKEAGDIIVVKRSPAVWGHMERRYFLIALYQDDDLEDEMASRGMENIIHPFMAIDIDEERNAPQIMERCAYQVDLDMFTGSPGLDGSVESGAVAPNGKAHLDFSDLKLRGPSPSSKQKAVILDSTGVKCELARQVVSDKFDVVDRICFTYGGKVWRHDLDVPDGLTPVDITNEVHAACDAQGISNSIMAYPQVSDLVDAGTPRAKESDAKYVIYGRTTPLPGALRRALGQNIVLVSPLAGWTDGEVDQEVESRQIPHEILSYEVDGKSIVHRRFTS